MGLSLLLQTLFPRLCTCKENELSPTAAHPAIVRLCSVTCPRQGAFVGSVVSPATMSHPHEVISISPNPHHRMQRHCR